MAQNPPFNPPMPLSSRAPADRSRTSNRRLIAWSALAAATVGVAIVGAAGGAGWPARAQVPVSTTTTAPKPPGTTTTTTSPVPPPTTPGPGGVPSSTTTTTEPGGGPGSPSPGGGSSGSGGGSSGSGGGSSGSVGPPTGNPLAPAGNPGDVGTGVVPPQYQAAINSVRRTPPNNDKALLDALQPLVALGVPQLEAYVVGMGSFPVAGYASFGDDFLEPRFGPPFHLHQGNDVFADCGLPIRSPADGVLRQGSDPLGGMADYVTMADGTYFYMAHLSAYVAGQASGQRVKTGQIVGFVGNTGDAAGGACHVHFEIHPQGGGAVDPKAFLDASISAALSGVPRLVALYQGAQRSQATAPIATGALLGGLDGAPADDGSDLALAAPTGPPRDSVLWSAATAPAGGALELASAQIPDMAADGWSEAASQQQAERRLWEQDRALVDAILAPTTPAALRGLLGFLPAPVRHS